MELQTTIVNSLTENHLLPAVGGAVAEKPALHA